MSKAIFQHQCTECKSDYTKETSWIDPSLYSDPGKATKTLVFWCPKTTCKKGQVLVLQMLPDNEVVLVEVIDHDTISTEGNSSYYKNKNKITERLTEEAALLVIAKSN